MSSLEQIIMFNPDGSIKLPEKLEKQKQDREIKMKNAQCVHIKRELTDFKPKKCVLHIKLSDQMQENGLIERTHHYFNQRAEVPTKLKKINGKQYEVEIGTDFRRCTDCNSFIRAIREFVEVLEDKGNCTFEHREFSYEDYFD